MVRGRNRERERGREVREEEGERKKVGEKS